MVLDLTLRVLASAATPCVESDKVCAAIDAEGTVARATAIVGRRTNVIHADSWPLARRTRNQTQLMVDPAVCRLDLVADKGTYAANISISRSAVCKVMAPRALANASMRLCAPSTR